MVYFCIRIWVPYPDELDDPDDPDDPDDLDDLDDQEDQDDQDDQNDQDDRKPRRRLIVWYIFVLESESPTIKTEPVISAGQDTGW